jgi:hypothetical protein
VLIGLSTASAQAPLGKLLARQYSSLPDNSPTLILVSFKDKGKPELRKSAEPRALLSTHAIWRRSKVRDAAHIIDEQDVPLEESYVQSVASFTSSIRHRLKWFNAVSAMATKQQIEEIRRLPFVTEVELVGRWRTRKDDEQPQPMKNSPAAQTPSSTLALNYGTSFTQVNQINVPAVHNLGFYGQGVVIGVFDNGFRNLAHQAFDSMKIIATHDFVDHKVSVKPNDTLPGFGSHGVWTLSTIGGYWPGSLIGPAFKSSFILARTENDSSETPIEEDNWAAAIQWADSIGVDVASTSLGYLGFDAPYTSLTWQDMNGHTALITNAADRAVGLGIVVVNSAGNSGFNPSQNTLIAPADGDSVITAGAVTSAGIRTSFSSVGPTTDNPPRIKPDVMAMGQGVKTASATDTVNYVGVSGTSFSCPLSAGVAALVLCANPSLTPIQVREAMRQTASNVCAPNNLMGWGILNALAAIKYYNRVGVISGSSYNDLNGNGIRDAGEPGINNFKIRLTCTAAESTNTNPSGNYAFDSLSFGTYTVQEDLPAGWIKTFPPAGSYSITLDSTNSVVTSRDFGNFRLGSIRGMKFNDANRDSIHDGGDTGLSGWVIYLTGPESLRTTTDTAGNYSFANLPAGVFTVRESTVVGWIQSVPPGSGTYTVTVRSGLDTTGLDFGNYFSSSYPVAADWNLLSLPKDAADHSKAVLYPTAISRAFSYAASSGYSPLDVIPNGVGYWMKFAAPQAVPITGTAILQDTVDVSAGWNLIGSLTNPVAVAAIGQIPGGIVNSNYFGFSGSYSVTSDSLRPHHGYWVRTAAPGKLALTSSSAAAQRRAFEPGTAGAGASLNTITVRDAGGRRQTLYFGTSTFVRENPNYFDLPPFPPEGAFDVRFSNGSLAWIPRGAADAVTINLAGAALPLKVLWDMAGTGGAYSLTDRSRTTELNPAGSLTISAPDVTSLRLEIGKKSPSGSHPDEYALRQNYPNPFNPTTLITYQIPADGNVRLEVYNLIGQPVRTLIDKPQSAGTYSVEWDGRSTGGPDLSSGIYFVRLNVTNGAGQAFTSTKKAILIR